MKSRLFTPAGYVFNLLVLGFIWFAGATLAFAEIEIDLDEASKPSTPAKLTPTPSNASHKIPVFTPTPTPVPATKESAAEPIATPEPEHEVSSETVEADPEPAPVVSKMRNNYDAGIRSYKNKQYAQAVKYLTKAVNVKDKRTPNYYYAEAYSTMGLIYQFHIIKYKTAYACYQKALKYEKNNKTAKKYIKQVKKKLSKGK